ncbi:MAG TPA: response regulator transcription factor [Candidatus Aquilonibacter sp.]|nr:response regulator transcription factor [Candidatus Aquilonibacter sp.]
MSKAVLIVDDEPQIGEVLSAYLEREGFATVVKLNVADALAELAERKPDAMILDITLPDGSGLDILRSVAGEGIAVLMLTARADELDRIVGLELGADDYITKPFSPREVVARVRAVMRRVEQRADGGKAEAGGDVVRFDGLEIDLGEHEVRVHNEPARLTPSEFRILTVLANQPGHAFTRAHLLDILGDDGSVYERTLDRHINNLRKKIEPDPEHPTFIQTVFGVGYKFRKS